jgi:drug/metabolite transporter (DMT)-like permease
MKVFIYTLLALFAFAGNSVLCRLALGDEAIDAASFTAIRLLAGALVLALILAATKKKERSPSKGSWLSASMLFLYALTFSFAYISLDTGIGALILFVSVQVTMIITDLILGNRLHKLEWSGLIIAFLGFVYLVMPTLGTPSLLGFVLMTLAGVAWGVYTLSGKGSENPLSDTAYNFFRTLPMLTILVIMTFQDATLSQRGIILAVLSGSVASGLGYTIWYMALRGLSTTQAAVVQLLVPVIAATAGVIFAGEVLSSRLIISSITILGGILAVMIGRQYATRWLVDKP